MVGLSESRNNGRENARSSEVSGRTYNLGGGGQIPLNAGIALLALFSTRNLTHMTKLGCARIAVTIFGMYVGRKESGTSDYFLAGKSVAWWAVAGSILTISRSR